VAYYIYYTHCTNIYVDYTLIMPKCITFLPIRDSAFRILYKIIIVKSYEFMIYNYVNFIDIFYDKELLALNYSKLNVCILIQYFSIHLKLIFHTFHIF